MTNLTDELNTIKTNNFKYLLILIYFIVVYSAFLYHDVSIYYHVIFIVGLVVLVIFYEKIERELASVKMRNFYIKAKLQYKIDELEVSINKNNSEFNKKILQNILEEIEV
ncbi:MAG: hypothetical protein KDC88_03560 [Ignavibacteriae bacterium]|nr:hypothetical protein [Ignavibacteriota bacterium]MCB9206799.1 hypothetical protein [Ignavibacteriales bacterium]MCB9210193.1 hypothetical protein [Ignavibacteriales bacterium]MCB9218422.1 hypothetical protein [Ignavibacteriales bacterium]MCB9259572.1 hypothetical protein [Ignavibacteriales bacterium]